MRFLLIPCVVLLILSIGCRRSSEEATVQTEHGEIAIAKKGDRVVVQAEDGTKATVETQGDKVKIETKDGRFTTGDSSLPEGFPLSLMPDSKVQQVNHMTPINGPEVFQVTTETTAEPKAVGAYYEKALKGKGLEVERFDSSSDQGSHVVLSARTDKVDASVAVMKEAGAAKCSVVITWSNTR